MITFFLLFGCMAANVEAPAFSAANEELRQYVLEAAENNPGLKAKWLEWQAALQKVPQVTTLEDPMFMYSQFLQSDETRFGLSLEQKFPWLGTLRARGDKALAEADAALARFYAARNQIIAEVKRAYFEYALLEDSMEIVQSQADTLTEVEEIVKSRYGLGLASQADLYRVQIDKDKLDDMRKGLEQSKPALSAKLQEALGREAGEELPWPQSADFPPPPPPAPVVLARIRVANPEIAAMQHMVESWEKETLLAKKRGYPEFSVGLGYENMKDMSNVPMPGETVKLPDGTTFTSVEWGSENVKDDIMVSLKLSLPIWRNRVKAGIREAELMQESVENDKRRITLSFDSAARMALYNIQDSQRRFNLYKDALIPKQKKTYESLQAYYGAGADPMESGGSADFLDIQNSVWALLEFQLEQARAERDLQVACAELEMLMGGPWTSNETQPSTPAEKDPAVRTVESQPPSPTETKP